MSFNFVIDTFSTRGGLHGSNNSLNPPKSNAIISTGNSPRESPTPGASAAASLNVQTPVSIPPSSSHSGGKYVAKTFASNLNFVEIKILDKVSSKTSRLTLNIQEETKFENLIIKVLKCKNSEFDDSPEVTAYMQVQDIKSIHSKSHYSIKGCYKSETCSIAVILLKDKSGFSADISEHFVNSMESPLLYITSGNGFIISMSIVIGSLVERGGLLVFVQSSIYPLT